MLPPLAAQAIGGAELLYVPAAMSPLKTHTPPTDAAHRLAMVELVAAGIDDASVSRIELDRPGPSYMVDTLEQLRSELGADVELRLLIGADQALQFRRWRRWERIIELAPPLVMLRPPWDRVAWSAALQEAGETDVARWLGWAVDLPMIDVSASELRRRLAAGEPVGDMIDPSVQAYIRRHGLYDTARAPT